MPWKSVSAENEDEEKKKNDENEQKNDENGNQNGNQNDEAKLNYSQALSESVIISTNSS